MTLKTRLKCLIPPPAPARAPDSPQISQIEEVATPCQVWRTVRSWSAEVIILAPPASAPGHPVVPGDNTPPSIHVGVIMRVLSPGTYIWWLDTSLQIQPLVWRTGAGRSEGSCRTLLAKGPVQSPSMRQLSLSQVSQQVRTVSSSSSTSMSTS